jgi:hypothetical protein
VRQVRGRQSAGEVRIAPSPIAEGRPRVWPAGLGRRAAAWLLHPAAVPVAGKPVNRRRAEAGSAR